MQREYYENNKERHKDGVRKRRAIKKNATVGYVPGTSDVLTSQGDVCNLCGVSEEDITPYMSVSGTPIYWHLDHIKPLSKGGDHAWWNVQVLCWNCNMSKQDKYEEVT